PLRKTLEQRGEARRCLQVPEVRVLAYPVATGAGLDPLLAEIERIVGLVEQRVGTGDVVERAGRAGLDQQCPGAEFECAFATPQRRVRRGAELDRADIVGKELETRVDQLDTALHCLLVPGGITQ